MAFLPWMKRKDENSGEEHVEVKLDPDTQAKLDKSLSVSDDLAKLKEQMAGLQSIQLMAENYNKDREAAARAAASRKQQETQVQSDEELQNLILTDPRKAIDTATQNQATAILTIRADQVKRDVFEDIERFPYYTGEIKVEIDKLLAIQSLQARNDPSVIENCYYTVVGKHEPEAREGKLKSRFASAAGGRGTSTGAAGTSSAAVPPEKLEINDDIRKAARVYGTTPEEYAKMVQDAGVV